MFSPFKEITAGQFSNDQFTWTYSLEQAFKAAKAKLKQLVTPYLPLPEDQLILEVAAAQEGMGLVLYAIKNGEKRMVRLQSIELDKKCLVSV